jgi:lysophospholipase L1-like esterase
MKRTMPDDLSAAPGGAPKSRLPRLFVLGDSISLHYGPYLEELLRGRWHYERKQGRTTDIDQGTGANGGDSAAVLAYLRERRHTGGITANWILLNCGLHDIKTDPATGCVQVERPAYEANLRAILDEIRRLRLRPVWARITPVVEALHNAEPRRKPFNRFARDVADYNAAADGIMRASGVPTIDLFALTLPRLPGGSYDGVHFNDDVRRLQAAYLAEALEALACDTGAADLPGTQ